MSGPVFVTHQLTPHIDFHIMDEIQSPKNENIVTDEGQERYCRGKLLGSGTYGKVYLAEDLETKEQVVIKQMKRFAQDEPGLSSTSLRETSLLKELKHEYIVELKDCFFTRKLDFCLVFGHCMMDLGQFITKNNQKLQRESGIERSLFKKWTFQMVQAICFMHSNRILHRDLKPPNILITKDMNIKVGDLGLGKEHQIPIHSQTTEIVTLWYRCPELMLGTNLYAGKVDIWSLGCIIAEMARGEPLFDGYCEWEMLIKIFQFMGTPKEGHPITDLKHWNGKIPGFKPLPTEQMMGRLKLEGEDMACDLIKKMLALNPVERLNAKKLLKHPFFDGLTRLKTQKPIKRKVKETDLNDSKTEEEWHIFSELTNLETPTSTNSADGAAETVKLTKQKTVTQCNRHNDDTLELCMCKECDTEHRKVMKDVMGDLTTAPTFTFNFGERRVLSPERTETLGISNNGSMIKGQIADFIPNIERCKSCEGTPELSPVNLRDEESENEETVEEIKPPLLRKDLVIDDGQTSKAVNRKNVGRKRGRAEYESDNGKKREFVFDDIGNTKAGKRRRKDFYGVM